MNLLSDVITYVRRLVKTPSNSSLTDALIIDYINRFCIMDVDARLQLFDYKTKYQFLTVPGVDQYNMPLYDVQTELGNQQINMYPVYQGFVGPAYIGGVQVHLETQKDKFFGVWPKIVQQNFVVGTGNGTAGPYTLQIPFLGTPPNPLNPPVNAILRGHVDISGIIAIGVNVDPPLATNSNNFIEEIPVTSVDSAVYFTAIGSDGSNIVAADSGEFLNTNQNLGLLMQPGKAPFGNSPLPGGYGSLVNITGITQANPAVITADNTFVSGQTITINDVVGMTEVNGQTYIITSVTPTTITINVDSTGFTPYVSGGTIVGSPSTEPNMINYLTGAATVTFPTTIPSGAQINGQCYFFQAGLPRAILYYNNVLTIRSPPSSQYLVELDAYLSPAAFLNSSAALPFGYMAEYFSLGAARKILSDTGDAEQLNFYEPRFREQELLVWKRSQRQWTATRTQTIYSSRQGSAFNGINNLSGRAY
jgi:hypothetical protein